MHGVKEKVHSVLYFNIIRIFARKIHSTFIQNRRKTRYEETLIPRDADRPVPCIVFAGHLYAAERTYNVLFIQSYNHRTPWNDRLTEGVRDGLSRGGIKAKVTTEYLDADYWTFASECVIMRRICERARQKNTDIIITSSDEAFYTLMHCGDSCLINYRL